MCVCVCVCVCVYMCVCLCVCSRVHLFKINSTYNIDRDSLSPLSICVSQLYR